MACANLAPWRSPETSPEEAVVRVNIGLDGTFYGDVSQAEEPESLSVLVNKYHPLPDGYVPRLHSLPARYGLDSRYQAEGLRSSAVATEVATSSMLR